MRMTRAKRIALAWRMFDIKNKCLTTGPVSWMRDQELEDVASRVGKVITVKELERRCHNEHYWHEGSIIA